MIEQAWTRAAYRATRRTQGALVWAMRVACVAAGTVMAGAVFLGVFYRYVLGDSLAYATALPTLLFPYFVMSGAILAAAKEDHLNVDFVLARMPDLLRRWVPFATRLLVVVAFAFVALVCVELVPTIALRTMPLLGWPASWAFYSLPVGFGGLALYTATETLAGLLEPDRNDGQADDGSGRGGGEE